MALTADQIAAAVKGAAVVGPDGRHSITDANAVTAIACALAAQAADPALPQGYWGHGPGDINQQVFYLIYELDNHGWSGVPMFANGRFQLYVPQAVVAFTNATKPPDRSGGLSDTSTAPGGGLELQNPLSELAGGVVQFTDPLFWRSLYFIAGGWILIGVAVYQLLNGAIVQPVVRGITAADQLYDHASDLNRNVVRPLRAWRRWARAGRNPAPAPAPAPASRPRPNPGGPGSNPQPRGPRLRPLSAPYDPNARPAPPRPKANRAAPPPPAKKA